MRYTPFLLLVSILVLSNVALPAATSPAVAQPTPTASRLPTAEELSRVSTAVIPAVTLSMEMHNSFVDLAKKGNIDVLFLGDSITDWWRESDPATKHNGKQVFDKYFGNLKVANFGIAGETTQQVLWRLQNGEGTGFQPKVVMLMIGTNNLRRNTDLEIAQGIAMDVGELRKDFPATKILLLGIFPRGVAKDPVRERIATINRAIAGLNDLDHIFYLDIGRKFLAPDGSIPTDVMSESSPLHPTAKGYEIWAQAVKEPLANLLKTALAK